MVTSIISSACKCLPRLSGCGASNRSYYEESRRVDRSTKGSGNESDGNWRRRFERSNSARIFYPDPANPTTKTYRRSMSSKIKPPPIERLLECTLEELFNGHTKKRRITRNVFTDTGGRAVKEEIVAIEVKPGCKKGTKVTFEGMGDERVGMEAADLTFVIAEKAHPLYRRQGDDLEMTKEVPLIEALTGCNVSIPMLNGDNVRFRIDDIIYPGYQVILSQQGMPVEREEGRRGDLKIKFVVNFPSNLSDEQKSSFVTILHNSFSD